MEFFNTLMGKRFFESTLPKLIESNNRLAKAQEEANKIELEKLKQINK